MAGEDDPDPTVRANSANALSPDRFDYSYAPSPDIIRTHQKDAYFTAVLTTHLSTILRSLYGARISQTRATETRTAADLLYLGLTTLIGNRTLGEEYCDVVQVEDKGRSASPAKRLPSLWRRVGFVAVSVLVPYVMGRVLPVLRRWMRGVLERRLARAELTTGQGQDEKRTRQASTTAAVQRYLLKHIDTITSPAPIYALSLATFYFTGAYYEISKRVFNFRYIFTRKIQPSDQHGGYEVLGVLMVLQLAVQGYLHVQETVGTSLASMSWQSSGQSTSTAAGIPADVEIGLGPAVSGIGEAQPLDPGSLPDVPASKLSLMTHTPVSDKPQIDLANKEQMMWLNGRQARKCTLCLEAMKDPAATTCGHIFCWSCICDWCREKPECPLCRQGCTPQHVLMLRG